jgi:hypothetical protein
VATGRKLRFIVSKRGPKGSALEGLLPKSVIGAEGLTPAMGTTFDPVKKYDFFNGLLASGSFVYDPFDLRVLKSNIIIHNPLPSDELTLMFQTPSKEQALSH